MPRALPDSQIENHNASLEAARDDFANRLLLGLSLLGVLAVGASLARIMTIGWQPVMALHLLLLLATWGVTLGRQRLPYGVRAGWTLVVMVLVILGALSSFALLTGAVTWMLALVFYVLLLFGPRAAFAALVASLACGALFARLHASGVLQLRADPAAIASAQVTYMAPLLTLAVLASGLLFGAYQFVRGIERREHELRGRTRRSEAARERIEQAVDQMVDALAIYDAEDRMLFCNDSFRALNAGIPGVAEPGIDFETQLRRLLDAGAISDAVGIEADWLERRMERHREPGPPFRLGRAGGQVKLIHEQRLADGMTVLSMTDITALAQAEAQVVQAAKLASLGEMATGIAHEINQPLNVIRMATTNIERAIGAGRADGPYLEGKLVRIQKNIDRAAMIIDQLRRFGRETGETHEPFDPRDAVRGALDMLGESLRLSEIDLDVTLPEACRSVTGHPIQLEQVVLNLVSNARDAIVGNNVAPGRIRVTLTDADGWVTIVVEDNGGGIPDEAMPKLFDPFFTTKEVGEGTGLGLSVSHGLIVNMGGTLSAVNVDGGARFEVSLPPT